MSFKTASGMTYCATGVEISVWCGSLYEGVSKPQAVGLIAQLVGDLETFVSEWISEVSKPQAVGLIAQHLHQKVGL